MCAVDRHRKDDPQPGAHLHSEQVHDLHHHDHPTPTTPPATSHDDNDGHANINRAHLSALGILAINLYATPGAGTTTLLTETTKQLSGKTSITILEGDQQAPHNAQSIGRALDDREPPTNSILFIESPPGAANTSRDLGKKYNIAILPATPGSNTLLQEAPKNFPTLDLIILTKIDLTPQQNPDTQHAIDNLHDAKPNLQVLKLSATTSQGMSPWLQWLTKAHTQIPRAVASKH